MAGVLALIEWCVETLATEIMKICWNLVQIWYRKTSTVTKFSLSRRPIIISAARFPGYRSEGVSPPQRFRGGLVFKVHRLLYHSTLGLTAGGSSGHAEARVDSRGSARHGHRVGSRRVRRRAGRIPGCSSALPSAPQSQKILDKRYLLMPTRPPCTQPHRCYV